MAKMIRLSGVPDRVHRILKTRARREGMSLSGYIKRQLETIARRPTMQEWLERTQGMKPISPGRSAATVLRELRDSR